MDVRVGLWGKLSTEKIDAFELLCWRRLLRVPWTARRSHQSILKEISPGCSLEGLMLKLKLQYFGHLMGRVDSLEKTLMLGGIGSGGEGGDRGWDGSMASPTRWTWVWVNSGSWWWQGSLACCDSWGRKESDMTERLNCSRHGFTFCSHKPAWISAQFGWLIFTSIFNFSGKRALSDPLGYLESRMHMGIWYIIISTNSVFLHTIHMHINRYIGHFKSSYLKADWKYFYNIPVNSG